MDAVNKAGKLSPMNGDGKQSAEEGEEANDTVDVYYFSYGSNMSREKMKTRGNGGTCGIQYDDVCVGRVDDWRLTFDVWAMSPSEPVMGSMEYFSGSRMYGVVYHITKRQEWEKLLRSEGIGSFSSPAYELFTVNALCYNPRDSSSSPLSSSAPVSLETKGGDGSDPDDGVIRLVHSLKTRDEVRIPNWREMYTFPSARYMSLLLTGAKDEALPPSYISYLESIPTARRWSPYALKFIALGSIMWWCVRLNLSRHYLWPMTVCGRLLYGMHEKNIHTHPKRNLINDAIAWLLFLAYMTLVSFYALPAILLICMSKKWRGVFRRVLQRVTTSQPSKTDPSPREIVLQKSMQKQN